ncbi:hypothetical protein PMIT1303_01480 [Prochlorococcus sp. MIT 1303]|nr:hypothetical protein PMIT1303_01480 [Prochlorococcus sp. MIT 1303]
MVLNKCLSSQAKIFTVAHEYIDILKIKYKPNNGKVKAHYLIPPDVSTIARYGAW